MLVEAVENNINSHLKNLLVPLSKLIANKNTREQTIDTLNVIDSLGVLYNINVRDKKLPN